MDVTARNLDLLGGISPPACFDPYCAVIYIHEDCDVECKLAIGTRLEKVTWWLERAKPGVLLMQETKLTDADARRSRPLYELVHQGEGQWNGVAIARSAVKPLKKGVPCIGGEGVTWIPLISHLRAIKCNGMLHMEFVPVPEIITL